MVFFLLLFLPFAVGASDIFHSIETNQPRIRLELRTEIPTEADCRALCTSKTACLAIVYSLEIKRCALMGESIAGKCTAPYTASLRIPEALTTSLTWRYHGDNGGSMYCGSEECIANAATQGYEVSPTFVHPTLMGTILKHGAEVMEQMRKICPEQSESLTFLDHHFDSVTKSDVPFLDVTEETSATTGVVSKSQGACGATVSINQYVWARRVTKETRRILSKTTPEGTSLEKRSVYWIWP